MENREQSVLDRIAERFSALDVSKAAVSLRRVSVEIPPECFLDLLIFAKEELKFDHLLAITGLDNGSEYEFIYHVSDEGGIVLNIKRRDGRTDPVIIPSVLPIFAGATFYERELEGLLGIKVDGLPEGRQYPLPDNWPEGEYPMRKGWQPPAQRAALKEEKQDG